MPLTRYFALDIETTALAPERGQVLEIAVVAETDWVTPVEKLPFVRILVAHAEIRGEPQALAMNARLIAEIADVGGTDPVHATSHLEQFFGAHRRTGERLTIAGKNASGFDVPFLRTLPRWDERCGKHLRHRVIDAGNLWWDPATDDRLPDTATCLSRAGLTHDRPHEALEDARNVIKLVRRWYAMRERFSANNPIQAA